MDTATPLTKGIAESVKLALGVAGISRRTASEQTGIPLTTLQRRLTGTSPFTITELQALANLTGTKVSKLASDAEQVSA